MRYFKLFRVCTVDVNWIALFSTLKRNCKHYCINVFVSLNCIFSFAGSLRKKLAHFLFIKSNEETHRNEHFSSQRNESLFHIFDSIKVSRVPNCKLGISMCKCRIPWNYTYTPYNHGRGWVQEIERGENWILNRLSLSMFLENEFDRF